MVADASTNLGGGPVRRLILIVSAGCIGLGLVSVTTLSAVAQTTGSNNVWGRLGAQDTSTYDVEAQAAFISQGSVIGANSAELAAVRATGGRRAPPRLFAGRRQHDTAGRFSAPGWKRACGRASGQVSYGGNYVTSGLGRAAGALQAQDPHQQRLHRLRLVARSRQQRGRPLRRRHGLGHAVDSGGPDQGRGHVDQARHLRDERASATPPRLGRQAGRGRRCGAGQGRLTIPPPTAPTDGRRQRGGTYYGAPRVAIRRAPGHSQRSART